MTNITDYLVEHVFPAAYAVLPSVMASSEASALLLAIVLQESGATRRRQVGGPARGFWQFESAGLTGVRRHKATQAHLEAALSGLCYPPTLSTARAIVAIEHNDVLACVFARLLLWTLPRRLPTIGESDAAWEQYVAAWRPGKPRSSMWPANYARAWTLVTRV